MENGSPSRRWVGVDFFDQVPTFRIETCLGGGLELLLYIRASPRVLQINFALPYL